jgi:hypothetical protein
MNETGRLFGEQREALQSALMSAFFDRARLDQFLSLSLDQDLEAIASDKPRGLGELTLAVLKDAQAEGYLDALVRAAHAANPGNPDLRAFHDAYVAAPPAGKLSRAQREGLSAALLSAFPSRAKLDQLLTLKLDRRLAHIVELEGLTASVLDAAEAQGWTDALIRQALAAVPGNPQLQRFVAAYDASSQREVDRAVRDGGLQLEKMVEALNAFRDVRAWRLALQEVEHRVCRLELFGPKAPIGTGFLVGRDIVLTNHHVLDKVWQGAAAAGDVVVRFDHHLEADGITVAPGTEHRLHGQWELAKSPPSPLDSQVGATERPGVDALDYVFVRLARPAADDLVEGAARGVVPYRRGVVTLAPDMGLVIVQHPLKHTLKLAIDTRAVTEVTPTRVRYRTNTEKGSSGSPCFTLGWELALLHHSGNPEKDVALYNEGVPMDVIRDSLPEALRGELGW